MTNEELKKIFDKYNVPTSNPFFFELASSLEQEPCEDCISRAEARKHIYRRLWESALNNVGYECKAEDVFMDIADNRLKTWIDELPSVQPKAIESEDAIDRENILISFSEYLNSGFADSIEDFEEYTNIVKKVPSVQPKAKTGHWIETTVRGSISLVCSECGADLGSICETNYCPNCGAKMESEDKE